MKKLLTVILAMALLGASQNHFGYDNGANRTRDLPHQNTYIRQHLDQRDANKRWEGPEPWRYGHYKAEHRYPFRGHLGFWVFERGVATFVYEDVIGESYTWDGKYFRVYCDPRIIGGCYCP